MGLIAAMVVALAASFAALFLVFGHLFGYLKWHRVDTAISEQSLRRRVASEPFFWGALLLTVALFLPWVTGSAIGIRLPGNAFGLPWVRWILVMPTLVIWILVALTVAQPFSAARLSAAVAFFVTSVLGAVALVLAAAAQRVSRYTAVADTLLRGIDRAHFLAPVVRVGPGEILFMVTGIVAGTWSMTRLVRSSRSEPDFPRPSRFLVSDWPESHEEAPEALGHDI